MKKFILFSFFILISFSSSSTFDDSLARKYMILLSSAAYSNISQICLDKHFPGAKVISQVVTPCDVLGETCGAYVFVDDAKKALGISFRGTISNEQMIGEAMYTLFGPLSEFGPGGKVATYFHDAFIELWSNGIGRALREQVNLHPNYQTWITGHSLGGAIASIAADYIAFNRIVYPQSLLLYTFGQPRTGNREYGEAHGRNVRSSFRVTHAGDIIPHVPFEFMTYRHHETEIFYRGDMSGPSFVVCDGPEDEKCSRSQHDLSMFNHRHYYGIVVPDYGKTYCGRF